MTSKTLLIPALLLLAPALAWSTPTTTPAKASQQRSHYSALYGSPAPVETVTRTITIEPGTRHVTVASGESVAIRAGGQTVDWTFLQAIGGNTMNLGLLMPGVPTAQDVYIHIQPSPIYQAG